MCRVASCFNRVIELNQIMLILSILATKIDFFYEFMTTELLINKDVSKTDQAHNDECIFKCRK